MDTKDLINALNDLIETCKDGEYGFSSSAEHLRNAEVRELFMRRADGCHTAAAELRTQVQALGGDAEDSGTVVGAAHRGWVAVKGKLAGYSDKSILEETERGEDSAMNRYRRVLQMDLPQADGSIRAEPRMEMQAVVDAFMTMVRLPLSANMLFVNVMATKMPFVGRG